MMLCSSFQLFVAFDPPEELRERLTESLAEIFNVESDRVGW
jgi:hypothetical protein